MGGARGWLWWSIVLVAAGCSHSSGASRHEDPECWQAQGTRSQCGDSATLRLQVLITRGELEQAEALLVQAIAAGLVTQTVAERLRERLAEQKQQQSSDPKRPPPPIPSPDEPPAERRSCWTELPGYPVCQQLPEEYTFHSDRQAFEAMKQRLGAKNLVLHNPDPAQSGPCPQVGQHHNVRMSGKRAGSIVCCPCCVESANGPLSWKKCRIVW
jgi:hypothetical protein